MNRIPNPGRRACTRAGLLISATAHVYYASIRDSGPMRLWTGPRPALEPTAILVVEPDETTAANIAAMLLGEGFRPVVSRDGRDALTQLAATDPGVVLVDYELPDPGGGPSLCRAIRARGRTPVIVISRSKDDTSAMASFDAGADDYMSQPSRLWELAARIRAALRRAVQPTPSDIHRVAIGGVELDVERHLLRVDGRAVVLPLREFQLLHVLLSSAGKTWTRVALMRRVWGELPASGTKSLDVHVKRIRARIEQDPSAPTRILTVRGVGYMYAAPAPDGGISA